MAALVFKTSGTLRKARFSGFDYHLLPLKRIIFIYFFYDTPLFPTLITMSQKNPSQKIRHAARNWLHNLLLAMQVVDAETLGRLFAKQHPLEVLGLDEKQRWYDWQEWTNFLEQLLSPLRIGTVKYHYLQSPQIQVELAEVHLQWKMSFWLLTLQKAPLILDCEATLVQENQRWVARRLHYRQSSTP